MENFSLANCRVIVVRSPIQFPRMDQEKKSTRLDCFNILCTSTQRDFYVSRKPGRNIYCEHMDKVQKFIVYNSCAISTNIYNIKYISVKKIAPATIEHV